MRKILRRSLSLILTLALVLSCMSIAASAAEKLKAPHYNGYSIFGDSITTGFGVKKEGDWDKNLKKGDNDYGVLTSMLNVPEDYYDADDIQGMRNISGGTTFRVHNSYPDLVGNAIGIPMKDDSLKSYANLEKSGFYNLALPGLRSTEVRMMVDPSYEGDELSQQIWNMVQPEGIDVLRAKTREYLQHSELVTINIGSNDIAVNCLIHALNVLHDTDDYDVLQKEVTTLIAQGRLPEAFADVYHKAKVVGMFPAMSVAYLKAFAEGSTVFFENWDPIIENIHKINPKAKIIAVGFNNPFSTYALTDFGDENYLRIGHALDAALGLMDLHISQLCSTKDLYTYVNAWNSEPIGLLPLLPGLLTGEYFDNVMFNVHPTNKGHAYIASQIVKSLNGDTSVSEMANILPSTSTDFYNIAIKSTDGGRMTSGMQVAREGDYIRLTAHPEDGYQLGDLTVIDSATGKKLDTQSYVKNKYTLYMPKGNLEVLATFVPVN